MIANILPQYTWASFYNWGDILQSLQGVVSLLKQNPMKKADTDHWSVYPCCRCDRKLLTYSNTALKNAFFVKRSLNFHVSRWKGNLSGWYCAVSAYWKRSWAQTSWKSYLWCIPKDLEKNVGSLYCSSKYLTPAVQFYRFKSAIISGNRVLLLYTMGCKNSYTISIIQVLTILKKVFQWFI